MPTGPTRSGVPDAAALAGDGTATAAVPEDPISILLVDDEPRNLTVLESILDGSGYRLVRATSADQALLALVREEFALLVLDVQLPGMTGFELAQMIKQRKKTALVPIIYLTAYYKDIEHVLEGYGTGAVDYLHKPVNPVILRAKVAVFAELHRKSREVARANRALVAEVAERRQAEEALRQANLAAEAANRELEAFSYSVAHDLRAPLRAIDGFSLAILEDCADQLDEVGKAHLSRVRQSVQRMAELIDDLLALSRVSRTQLHMSQVDLAAIARSVLSRLQAQDPGRSVEVLVPDEAFDMGDAHLLDVVFENLLGNAWKFTSKRALARIEFGRWSESEFPTYYIKDNGAGFDMTYVEKMFGVFQRLHLPGEFEGTGIGLATVQRIINRHGGRVWAQGEVDAGATFFFTLGEDS